LPLRIGLRRSPLDFPAMISFAFRSHRSPMELVNVGDP
jgi:hypothetical protein